MALSEITIHDLIDNVKSDLIVFKKLRMKSHTERLEALLKKIGESGNEPAR